MDRILKTLRKLFPKKIAHLKIFDELYIKRNEEFNYNETRMGYNIVVKIKFKNRFHKISFKKTEEISWDRTIKQLTILIEKKILDLENPIKTEPVIEKKKFKL